MDDTPLKLNYPADLPVCGHREEILSLLKTSQVVIVAGDTGSGKTTQLPKMAMELGYRKIACTQPRRIAAVAVAERVSSELGRPIGTIVGYQHRFAKAVSDETRIKFMTDGVLLAETRHDRLLGEYDFIIVDEAHERSLNIDFLLGILKRALPSRPELKLVISSATMDTEKFAHFFGEAKTIHIPGRLFPVETIYQIPEDGEAADLPREVARAIEKIGARDDVLVFLPGERDIRETLEHLSRSIAWRGDDIIALMASLPPSEQQRAFRPSSRRRIILSTNVAETSVTIPGIRAVIDSGLARIPRYIHRTEVERLQIEPVSQASARQRAGRCGRVGPGVCIRLYSEDDFNRREQYTPPEIMRSSLAGVILTMLDMKLGNIEQFPFIDPPRPAMIREGLRELVELRAIHHNPDHQVVLTQEGRQLARIPIEPRLARIMLTASKLATLPSAIVVVAALSTDDPKRRPIEEKAAADQAHAPFRAPGSDFLSILKLWRWWEEQAANGSQSRLRKLCAKNFLSYPKMRQWRDLVGQLSDLARRLGLDTKNDNGGEDQLHRALLSGLLSRIGRFDTESGDYRGAHAIRFAIHPSSTLAKKRRDRDSKAKAAADRPPARKAAATEEWVMAGELVDTARLFARTAATIEADWIEEIAGDCCKRSYHSPEWDAAAGFARVHERVTLYGLVLVPNRLRDFSRIDPTAARRIFLLHALVLGEIENPPPAVAKNLNLIREIRRRAEHRRDYSLFDADRLIAFFDQVLPKEVVSVHALKKFLARATAAERARFVLKRSDWIGNGDDDAEFPKRIQIGKETIVLSYRHLPGNPELDGITATVRKSSAQILHLCRADWLVPGALREKVAYMLCSLPPAYRRVVSPVADTVATIMPLLTPDDGSLVDSIRRALYNHNGLRIPASAFEEKKLPAHLKMRFRILDDASGRELASSRELDEALRAAGIGNGGTSAAAVEGARKHVAWDFGNIGETAEQDPAGWKLKNYPALCDEGDGVSLRLFKSAQGAAAAHERGVTRLAYLEFTRLSKPSFAVRRLPLDAALFLKALDYPTPTIAADLLWASIRDAAVRTRGPIRSAAAFAQMLAAAKTSVYDCRDRLEGLILEILAAASECSSRTEDSALPPETVDAIETQLAWLVFPGFVRLVPVERLKDYPRYFKALRVRLERAHANPLSDRSKEARFAPYWQAYTEATVKKTAKIVNQQALTEYRWMLEEYRISVFAQEIKTSITISTKRLEAKLAEAIEV